MTRTSSASARSLAELCGTASELAVYAGLAVGGYEAHSPGTWQLAVAATIVLAVRRTLVACSRPAPGRRPTTPWSARSASSWPARPEGGSR